MLSQFKQCFLKGHCREMTESLETDWAISSGTSSRKSILSRIFVKRQILATKKQISQTYLQILSQNMICTSCLSE